MSKLTKISKQHPRTWAQLHRRLITTTFDYECLFSEPVSKFVSRKATSINSNMGYLVSALLTSTLFVLSMSAQLSTFTGFETVPNIYTVFVGPPSTGKSQAIKEAASGPLNRLIEDKDLVSFLIETATPSGLFKKLSEDNKGFLLSPEVYDVLFKLLQKEDESNGYAALMCELFSGEGASYTMATRSERKIAPNTPFSILGSTQLQPLAKLLVAMDQGQGLIDRFIFIVPTCFRPTPEERERASSYVKEQKITTFDDFFSAVYDLHLVSKNYAFDETASEYLKEQEDAFITLLNDALRSGAVPPKCKKIDIAQRLALAIHVCESILSQLLQGNNPTAPPEKINRDTLCKSFQFLDYCEMQKEILLEFVDAVTNSVMEEERKQPNVSDVKTAICLFCGPVVNARCFKQSAPRFLRSITQEEFITACKQMEDWGKLVQVKIARNKPMMVFVKRNPREVDWSADTIVSEHDYTTKFTLPVNKTVPDSVKTDLVAKGYIDACYLQTE